MTGGMALAIQSWCSALPDLTWLLPACHDTSISLVDLPLSRAAGSLIQQIWPVRNPRVEKLSSIYRVLRAFTSQRCQAKRSERAGEAGGPVRWHKSTGWGGRREVSWIQRGSVHLFPCFRFCFWWL